MSTSVKAKVRQTPSLAEVRAKYGRVRVKPYDEHFLLRTALQNRTTAKIKAIADAGEALLADPEVGLDWITSSAVSEKAGISVGGFYRYFEDIVALLDYIWPERKTTYKRRKSRSS